MKNLSLSIALLLLFSNALFAQVGINTDGTRPDTSAMLDVKSTMRGMLIPRMTTAERDAIVTPALSLMIYNTTTRCFEAYNPMTSGWESFHCFACPVPATPAAGNHLSLPSAIVWNWDSVSGANGYKWNTTNNYGSAIDMGVSTTMTESSLICNTTFVRYVWAYNICGNSAPVALTQSTLPCFSCGSTLAISHLSSGGFAPVDKTLTYGTVTNIPGEPSKCWITRNLGADHQAGNVNDATEPSAGWYWQFDRKQGYMHDGTNRTPNTTWNDTIISNLDWEPSKDPCAHELGNGWRVPTYSEWDNVNSAGNWNDWYDLWNSGLKIHAAGFLDYMSGSLINRGSDGTYWSSTQGGAGYNGWELEFGSGYSYIARYSAADAFPLRCLRDASCTSYNTVSISITPSANPSCAGSAVTFTATPTNGGTSPAYEWKVNAANAGTNSSTFNHFPAIGDAVTCELTSNASCIASNFAISNTVTMAVDPMVPVFVTITGPSGPICSGMTFTFSATPTNGGTTPFFQWQVNGSNVGPNNPIYGYIPSNGDVVRCMLISSLTCATNPAFSNAFTMIVEPFPVAPASGTHLCSGNQIIWNWNSVPGAMGYRWNTINDFGSAIDLGSSLAITEPGLIPGISYTRFVWAYNNCGVSAETAMVQLLPFIIGQSYEGGVIFYIDPSGQHGLISATSDQSTTAEWGCFGTMTGVTLTAIGMGQPNTSAIAAICTSPPGFAAQRCDNLSLNGYNDWFLPSLDELNEMYLHQGVIGGFSTGFYWSSSETNPNDAWSLYFNNGMPSANAKNVQMNVRAIRGF